MNEKRTVSVAVDPPVATDRQLAVTLLATEASLVVGDTIAGDRLHRVSNLSAALTLQEIVRTRKK